MQEEALKLSAAAHELWSKKPHSVGQSFGQERCTEAPAMKYAASVTTRGETRSSTASTSRQGCPAAGRQEFCHLLNASSFCTCRPPSPPAPQAALSPGVQRTCPQVRAQIKELSVDAGRHVKSSRTHIQLIPDFLKMPKSCNPN